MFFLFLNLNLILQILDVFLIIVRFLPIYLKIKGILMKFVENNFGLRRLLILFFSKITVYR